MNLFHRPSKSSPLPQPKRRVVADITPAHNSVLNLRRAPENGRSDEAAPFYEFAPTETTDPNVVVVAFRHGLALVFLGLVLGALIALALLVATA